MAKNGFEIKDKEGRREENVEGLVRKSKGFLPMNLSNPKGESFDAKGIGCEGEERSITSGLKEKLAGGFSLGITLGFFNSFNRARGFSLFFLLIIHIQRGKLYFRPNDENEENKRNEAFLTYKKL